VKPESSMALSHIVPRPRDREGNVVPGKLTAHDPLLSLDGEALLSVAEVAIESPEEAQKREPWLRARNAVKAQENVQTQRQDFVDAREANNERLAAELEVVQLLLDAARLEEQEASTKLAEGLATLGLIFRDSADALSVEDGDLPTLEVLAGQHGLDTPSSGPSALVTGFVRAVAIVGAGAAIGLGLGMMLGYIEPSALAESPSALATFLAMGMVVMTLVHAGLAPLALLFGERLGQVGAKSERARQTTLVIAGLALVVLALAFVLIDAKVEQAGIFRAVVEESSLTTTRLTAVETWLVSLMISLPAVAGCIVMEMTEGMRRANTARLLYLCSQEKLRIEGLPAFAKCCGEYQAFLRRKARLAALESKVAAIESAIRWEDNETERLRREETEADAAAHSYATERALFGREPSRPARRFHWPRWRSLFPRWRHA
jgi:hypothetical protein